MTKHEHSPQVGAPDPELRNSPIFDSADNDEPSLDRELESDGCYFNDERYDFGEVVRSGHEVLRCNGRGVWLRIGED